MTHSAGGGGGREARYCSYSLFDSSRTVRQGCTAFFGFVRRDLSYDLEMLCLSDLSVCGFGLVDFDLVESVMLGTAMMAVSAESACLISLAL